MSKLNPAEVSDRFISFVDLIESRAMASDGPVTPFLDELVSCSAAEKQRFTAILRDLYRVAGTKAVVIVDTPTLHPREVPKYLNLVNGKIYEFISEDAGAVTFRREGGEKFAYLGRGEFDKRFQLVSGSPSPQPQSYDPTAVNVLSVIADTMGESWQRADGNTRDVTSMCAYLAGRLRTSPPPQSHVVGGLSIADLQRAHVERQEEWCPDQKPDLSFRGNELGGECGEAQNVIKKLERERHGWRGSRDTIEHLGEELADVIHCTVLVAITAGIDLEPAVIAKFNSTSEKNGLATMLRAALATASKGSEDA